MVALAELVQKPIVIEGKVVILVQDLITDQLEKSEGYTLVAEATDRRPPVYLSEQNLREMRARFPTRPVYGFWQVLYESGLLKQNRELQIMPIGKRDGWFVRIAPDSGRLLLTGEYTDGIFQGAGDLLLEEATPVDFAIRDLKLPPEEARLWEEVSVIEAREKSLKRTLLGAVVAGIVLVAGLTDQTLRVRYETGIKDYEQKKVTLSSVQQEVARLQRTKISSFPSYAKLLNQLDQICTLNPSITMPLQDLATKTNLTVILPKEYLYDPQAVLDWVKSVQLPNSHWQIFWPNPGIRYGDPPDGY